MKGQHDGFNLASHLQSVLQRFGLDTRILLGVTTDNASSNYSMTRCLQKILEAKAIEWSASQNHIPCTTHVIQLTLGAFMVSLGMKGRGKSWEDTEREKIGQECSAGRGRLAGSVQGGRVEKVESLEAGINKIVEKVGDIAQDEPPIAAVSYTNLVSLQQRLLAVVINGSPKRRDDFLETQRGKEAIAVTLILDVKTRWNSTLAMLERAYRLKAYTFCWLSQYPQYQPLFTTDDEWKAVEYVLQVLLPFRYWTLWMSKRRTITLHRVISIYNGIFDHLDSVLKALAKKRVQWKRDIHRAVRCARAKLRKYYSKVTPDTGLILILATILDPFRKLQTFKAWDKEVGLIGDEAESYKSQYSNAFLAYWESNYVNNEDSRGMEGDKKGNAGLRNLRGNEVKPIPRIYGLESSDEEDEPVIQEIHETPRSSSRKSLLMQQARQYLANPRINHELQQYREDYPVGDEMSSNDPEEITASFWYPDVAGWWLKQETTMGEFRDLAKMARDIFSVMPHGVGVEASFSLGRDVISWRQSRTNGITLQHKVVVRQWARSNNGLLPEEVSRSMKTDINTDEQQRREDKQLNQLASMKDFLSFKRQSDNMRSMQRELKGRDVSISGLGYISDEADGGVEEWSGFNQDGNSAFRKISKEKRPNHRNFPAAIRTKVCYGTLVGKVQRVQSKFLANFIGNAESDTPLSESEAAWLLSDSEVDELDEGYIEREESDNEDIPAVAMEEDTPDHGLLIPGFQKVVRRSTRLELRHRIGIRKGESTIHLSRQKR